MNVKICFLCEETWPLPYTLNSSNFYIFTDFLSNRIITLKYQQRFTALVCKDIDIVIRKPDSIPVEKERPSLHVTCIIA